MPLAQTASGWRRPATAQEIAVFDKWRAAVERGRVRIEAMIAGGAVCSYSDQFRQEYAPHLAPCVTTAQADHILAVVGKWNRLEEIYISCERDRFGIQVRDGDVWVFASPTDADAGAPLDATGLGIVWFVVVGIVLIVGAIVTTEALDYAAKTDDNKLRAQFNDLSAKMAKEPVETRAAWEAFLKSSPVAKEKSIWDRLGEGVSSALSMVALGALAYFAISAFSKARASRGEARISNPCGRGLSPKRGGWSKSGKVRWADDGSARGRQIRHIEDHYYGGPQWAEESDEVPF